MHNKKVLKDLMPSEKLIAYGFVRNNASNSTAVASGSQIIFSESSKIPSKVYHTINYEDDDILTSNSGTFYINPKGKVKRILATVTFSGLAGNSCYGIWFSGNANPLPSGVQCFYPAAIMTLVPSNYGGVTCQFLYELDEGVTEKFYINPQGKAYNGAFTPCQGGVQSSLYVEVYG